MKTLKIIIVCILTATASTAQYYTDGAPDQRDILQFGIKVGANNSNLYDTRGQDFVAKPIFGPVFGGFLSIPIGKYLGIQPEVLYSAKGYAGSGAMGAEQYNNASVSSVSVKGSAITTVTAPGGDPQNYSYIDRINYIDVPIMLQLKLLPSIYLLGGPEYSYLISRSYTFTNGITTETTQQQFQNDNIRHNIFGLITGIDLNLSSAITLGGRVAWDEQDNNGDGTSTLPRYRNFWGQVALGVRF